MTDPLNRSNAPRVVRLFDVCFKRGVYDACELDDQFATKEFIDTHKMQFSFGILGDDVIFVLYKWARQNGLTPLGENYILFIRNKSHLWPLLPYCMRFYILGMEEWLKYPNRQAIGVFKQHKRIHWDPESPVKRFTLSDYTSYMHEFAYEYRKLPVERMPISPGMMDSYCLALYDLTRAYVSKTNGRI